MLAVIKMKKLILIFLLFVSSLALGQRYEFTENFIEGSIVIGDSTERIGYIKWDVYSNEKVRFKTLPTSEIEKFKPSDITGLRIDSIQFQTLFNLEAIASDYALAGVKTKLKAILGEILHKGTYDIYKIYVVGYNAIAGTTVTTANFVFMRGDQKVCYPYGLRMRQKKYNKAKKDWIELFEGYQEIIEMINNYQREESIDPIIKKIKSLD